MPVLNIRNLNEDVHARLRLRAARAGRSMEAEARAILAAAVAEEDDGPDLASLPAWVDKVYGTRKPKNVVATLLAERKRESRRG
jgi:plasmid stability protein